jgi:hypothetical protein
MKTVSLLISIVFMCMGCNSQKKVVDSSLPSTTVLEYEAMSRGSYWKTTVQNQMLSVIKKRDALPVVTKISDADWKEIVDLYKEMDLKGLAGLKAPSEKRFYDGAAIANFRVISEGTSYQTPEFDGGFPNSAIEKIINKLADLAEKQ